MLALLAALATAAHASGAAQDEYVLRGGDFVKTETPLPASPSGELQAVRQALADNQPKRAIKLATQWIKAHPGHADLPFAYTYRADAYVMNGNYYKSLFDYELVARAYPGSKIFPLVLERELEVATAFAHGMRRKFIGMRFLDATAEAEELLIRIQERAPGSRIAERAGKELADYYYRDGNMLLAAEAYAIFIDNYPRSKWAEHAHERQVTASLATFKGPRFDATGLYEAERRTLDYQDAFPGPAEAHGAKSTLVRIDESLANKSLTTARWYDKVGQHVSAQYMYSRVVLDHPNSAAAALAMQRLVEVNPKLADRVAEQAPRVRPKGQATPQDQPVLRPDTATDEPADVEVNAPIVDTPDFTEPNPQ